MKYRNDNEHDAFYPECPNGGDEANDCDGCAYSGDYHFSIEDGACIERRPGGDREPDPADGYLWD